MFVKNLADFDVQAAAWKRNVYFIGLSNHTRAPTFYDQRMVYNLLEIRTFFCI